MRQFDGVIFDFDGTLADTAQDVWDSVRYGFSQCGLALPPEFSGDNRNLALPVQEMVARIYPGTDPGIGDKAEAFTTRHYRFLSAYRQTMLYPALPALLTALREAGTKTGILSNKGDESLTRILRQKGWCEYFTSWRGMREGDPPGKGDRLAVYRKEFGAGRLACVGDSAGDIAAAKKNGLFSVGVLYGDGDRNAVIAAGPDVICRTDAELLHYFLGG